MEVVDLFCGFEVLTCGMKQVGNMVCVGTKFVAGEINQIK